MKNQSVFKYNLIFYNSYLTKKQTKALQFCLTKPVSFELITRIINTQIKQDSDLKTIEYQINSDILAFGFYGQLDTKQKERLYEVVKPIVQRYQ